MIKLIMCKFGIHNYTKWVDDGTFSSEYRGYYRQKKTCINCNKLKTRKINYRW